MRRRLPPLNALKSFEAAARKGSFREAADELAVSHSAVSHQIKHLEEYLGIELFIRKPRAVELSAAGLAYYPVLRDAFDRIAGGTSALLRPQADNILTVQMYSTFAIRWLIPRLPAFNAEFPDLQLRLNTSQSDVDFDHQDIDLCVMIGKEPTGHVHADRLFVPTWTPVCSPRLLECGVPLVSPADLAKHTILQVYPSEQDWNYWLEKNGVEGVDPDSGIRLDSYDHALKTAARGLGVALGSEPYISQDLESGILVQPFPERRIESDRQWYVVTPIDRANLPKVRIFREWILQQVMEDTELRELSR